MIEALFWMWLGAVSALAIKRGLDDRRRRRMALDIDRALRRDRRRGRARLTVLLAVLFTAGCGDNIMNPPELVAPDAANDAELECIPPRDAAADSCCRLSPDERAIRVCFAATLPPDTCGVIACERADCTFLRVNVCGTGAS